LSPVPREPCGARGSAVLGMEKNCRRAPQLKHERRSAAQWLGAGVGEDELQRPRASA
jgi:hypothetical protein